MVTPKVNSEGAKELQKAQEKFDQFDAEIKSKTADPLGKLPVAEQEQQTKLSTKEIDKTDGLYLKPIRTISCKEQFNEAHRQDYEFGKERVRFIAEHYEIIGDTISVWTRGFPGVAAEQWEVPTNKVVIGPRYLAEQIARKSYTRLKMDQERPTTYSAEGTYTGQMIAESKIQRLSARPAAGFNQRKTDFV
jgi:hypothetical protein